MPTNALTLADRAASPPTVQGWVACGSNSWHKRHRPHKVSMPPSLLGKRISMPNVATDIVDSRDGVISESCDPATKLHVMNRDPAAVDGWPAA